MKIFKYTFFMLLYAGIAYGEEAYQVTFQGLEDCAMEEELRSISQVIELQERPPGTRAALRRRAENDIPRFIKILHGNAYYNAHITVELEPTAEPLALVFNVDLGPQYPFAHFELASIQESSFDTSQISAEQLGICLGQIAYPRTIIDAEERLLNLMERSGYPLSAIVDRKVIADQLNKEITLKLTVNSGPLTYFGPLTICGNDTVKDLFFWKKLRWCEGDRYDPCQVERTLDALESSALFSSIEIHYVDEIDQENAVPMEIHVTEANQRSIGAGLSFTTQRGSGVTAEWEHRNLYGLGEKFRINANLWQDTQEIYAQYVRPDFWRQAQDLVYQAELQHADTKGYKERSFTLSAALDRQINDHTRFSYGVAYKELRDSQTDDDGEFSLIKAPVHFHWHNTTSLLDPRDGESLYLSVIPSFQLRNRSFGYVTATASGALYRPFDLEEKWVIAVKGTVGTIVGSPRRILPPSERFYAGTQDSMRGYRYLTVSPLNDSRDKPIGGRSMLLFSTELRIQATEDFGWVLFSDFGQGYANWVPDFKDPFLQSVGLGLRYFTAVGPLRFDFAVPLNKRPKIDRNYQFYISVGQAF